MLSILLRKRLAAVAVACGCSLLPLADRLVRGDDEPSGQARLGGGPASVTPAPGQAIRPNYAPYYGPGYGGGYDPYCYGGQQCANPLCCYKYGATDPCTLAGKFNAHNARAQQVAWYSFKGAARLAYCGPLTVGYHLIPHSYCAPADPGWRDPRDRVAYSDVGYGVPMSVPLAPVVKHSYNYGWGVASSRMTRVNSTYDKMYPQTWYTQAGSVEATSHMHPPVIAVPTDTAQQGAYYKHVPTWQPVADPRTMYPAPLAIRMSGQGAPPAGRIISSRPVPKAGKPAPAPVAAPRQLPPATNQGIDVSPAQE